MPRLINEIKEFVSEIMPDMETYFLYIHDGSGYRVDASIDAQDSMNIIRHLMGLDR